ncbi:hypothetical protein [aff. Roholtiella sp. LEGE 12411]|uniref:hypothetical protein n=1 Tax=aff. Roholtiella sp. LEGE 12411 TaxID=1828822 RepID=UPI001881A141|nr:hypothetical protein [aff. Roholtiella sp. LEGE 12411]MBE9036971.1 hypothetical protein [aff. Roholtiella sp. LEGE 12411]
MLYVGSGYDVVCDTGLSYQLADSRLRAIIKEWLLNRTVRLKQVSTSNQGWTPGQLKRKFGADTGLYCFSGTMVGCVLEVDGLVKQINGRIPYLKTNLKLDKTTALKMDYGYIDSSGEREKVDRKNFYSAAKYYTTQFRCHVFKEHFGDGADTQTDMVDSWERVDELGVKITSSSTNLVYFDVPDQFVEHIPSFIQPWIPCPC